MTASTRRRLSASLVYLGLEAGLGFLYTMLGTIYAVYVIVDGGLDPFRLLILGTVVEGTVLVFEIPTGVAADVVGRRFSVIVGMFVSGTAFIVTGASPRFAWLVLGQVLWGIGATFISGAEEAWITDEVGEDEAARLYLRGAQRFQAGALLGIPAAVGLGAFGLGWPIIATGIGHFVVGVLLIVWMPETGFGPGGAKSGDARGSMRRTLADGVRSVRRSHILALILVVAALHGASTEAFDRLSQLHLLKGTSFPHVGRLGLVAWFGAIEAVGLLLAIGAAEVLKRRADVASHAGAAKVLALIDGLLIASVVLFAMTGSFVLALGMFWIVALLREVREPVATAWLNRGLDPATRATVNSMAGQADAIGQVAGGPALGGIAVWWSVPAAIAVAGVLRAPVLALYARALRRGEPDEPAPDVDATKLEITGMPGPG